MTSSGEADASGVGHDLGGYYARRAEAYERIYGKPERQADLRRLEALLPAAFEGRRVLEVACGTGWWTPHGARRAADWLATDLNPETLALARRKSLPACVRWQTLDAFDLRAAEPPAAGPFDAAFAGFWWSHVALDRLPQWLHSLHEQLAPGARVLMLDNAYVEGSSTPISRTDAEGNRYQLRRLDDGSLHEVLKNFPTEAEARQLLRQAEASGGLRVRDLHWHAVGHYWLLDYSL